MDCRLSREKLVAEVCCYGYLPDYSATKQSSAFFAAAMSRDSPKIARKIKAGSGLFHEMDCGYIFLRESEYGAVKLPLPTRRKNLH